MKTIARYIDSIKSIIEYSIGGSATENNDLIDASDPTDIWFHIEGASSCHVVAKLDQQNQKYDKKQLLRIITQGAVICKENSRYKSDKKVAIVYCKIQDLTKTDKLGQVIVAQSKTILI